MDTSTIDWQKLVDERNSWVDHNFPHRPGVDPENPIQSIIGCIEEMGELAHAHLKQHQNIRGDNHEADAKDAIGDLTVYLLGVMSHLGNVPEMTPRWMLTDEWWVLRSLANEVGQLAINPSQYACERIVYLLDKYCEFREWDYEQIVKETWDHVKQRDWIKYPDTGMPPKKRTANL